MAATAPHNNNNNNNTCIDLLSSDDDEVQENKGATTATNSSNEDSIGDSKPPAVVHPPPNNNAMEPTTTIDLVNLADDDSDSDNDDDNNDNKMRATAGTASNPIDSTMLVATTATRKKNKRLKRTAQEMSRTRDAIDIDNLDSSTSSNTNQDETLRYRQALGPFRMEFVTALEHPSHLFSKKATATATLPTTVPAQKRLHRECVEYQLNLPVEVSSGIFVRALEARVDLLRVLITGPSETPYEHGCFFLDVWAQNYPRVAPQVKFLTTGQGQVRFNPNLYNDGKVCLSLLGTWSGPGWQPNKSTLLQVFVSIQGLILVPDPYFNEPGFEKSRGTPRGNKESRVYTLNIRKYTLQYAMLEPLKALTSRKQAALSKTKQGPRMQFLEFASVMVRHFCQRAQAIQTQLATWMQEDKSCRTLAQQVQTQLNELLRLYPGHDPNGTTEPIALDDD